MWLSKTDRKIIDRGINLRDTRIEELESENKELKSNNKLLNKYINEHNERIAFENDVKEFQILNELFRWAMFRWNGSEYVEIIERINKVESEIRNLPEFKKDDIVYTSNDYNFVNLMESSYNIVPQDSTKPYTTSELAWSLILGIKERMDNV